MRSGMTRLVASRPQGKRPRIDQFKDETTEAKSVVREIRHLINNEHVQPRDIAILFRTNEQPRLFETELRKKDVPYVMFGAQSFFDRKEVRDIVAYLKWIEQPADEVTLLRVINTPPRGLCKKTVQLLLDRAVQRGVPIWEVMIDAAISDLSSRGHAGSKVCVDRQRCSLRARMSADRAMETLLARTAYTDEMTRLYDKPEERESRVSSFGEITNAFQRIKMAKGTRPDRVSHDIALSGKEMGSEKDRLAKQNAVWLLTLHAAKGLEFPFVFMVGMEEDYCRTPQRQEREYEEAIAEERRLCYVGITRAQEDWRCRWL